MRFRRKVNCDVSPCHMVTTAEDCGSGILNSTAVWLLEHRPFYCSSTWTQDIDKNWTVGIINEGTVLFFHYSNFRFDSLQF